MAISNKLANRKNGVSTNTWPVQTRLSQSVFLSVSLSAHCVGT